MDNNGNIFQHAVEAFVPSAEAIPVQLVATAQYDIGYGYGGYGMAGYGGLITVSSA
jgi:hypothetical protein